MAREGLCYVPESAYHTTEVINHILASVGLEKGLIRLDQNLILTSMWGKKANQKIQTKRSTHIVGIHQSCLTGIQHKGCLQHSMFDNLASYSLLLAIAGPLAYKVQMVGIG